MPIIKGHFLEQKKNATETLRRTVYSTVLLKSIPAFGRHTVKRSHVTNEHVVSSLTLSKWVSLALLAHPPEYVRDTTRHLAIFSTAAIALKATELN